MRHPIRFACAAILALAAVELHAFRFQPITMEFDPAGPGAVRSFRLENPGTEPVAVRISMLSRDMLPDGSELNAPADSSFMVYPSRIMLSPGAFQTVRVKWQGDSSPSRELSFRIVAEQLPVERADEPATGNSIRIMFRYIGSVYIVPHGAAPAVEVERAAVEPDNEGGRRLSLTLINRGTSHSVITEPVLTLTAPADGSGTGSRVVLSGEELEEIEGENLLSARKRVFHLPCPETLPDGELEAKLTYRDGR